MTSAGLVDGVDGSRHPLIMVFEREAASFSCHKVISDKQILRVGEKLLVADIGYGTSDIVVQEVVSAGKSGYRLREVTIRSGDLCGRSYVDKEFMEILHRRIGPCLQECLAQQPSIFPQLVQAWWDAIEQGVEEKNWATTVHGGIAIGLPAKVATEWELYDQRMCKPQRNSYHELVISDREMQPIFDPTIDVIKKLISDQLDQVGAGAVKALVVVGGFARSSYLLNQIRNRFAGLVPQIVSPPNPVTAVCQGAVMLALIPHITISNRATASTCEDGATESTFEDDGSESSLEDDSSEPIFEDVVKKYAWDEVSRLMNGPTSRELGKGGFGKVYLGKLESGKEVAVKSWIHPLGKACPSF